MWVNDIIDRIKLPFRKEKELFSALYDILGFYPRNINLYKQALLHKSASKRNEKGRPVNNERLEFLGDAILDAVVGDIVFRHFEGKREGFLTNTRSKLVSRDTLGKLAKEMGISDLIKFAGHNTSHNSYMNGNAFEALVGAIYLDRGYDACMRFMEKRILAQLISPVFTTQVFIEGLEGCVGTGYSKKESQQNASKDTLQRLRREPQFIDAVFAAKGDRTKMEEEPVMCVPDPEKEQQDFIIEVRSEEEVKGKKKEVSNKIVVQSDAAQYQALHDEFTLDDISAKPREKTREEIIAEAEAAAFAEA